MNKLAYLAISSSLLGFSSAFVQAPVAVNVRTVAPVAPQYAPTQDGAPVPDPRGVRAPRTQAVDPIGTANAPRLDPRVASAPRR